MADLISRAALRDVVSSVSMPWDFVDAINAIAAINILIDEAPTIDAIPVEWLREKMQKPQTTCMNPFGFVLAEWLEEQELR